MPLKDIQERNRYAREHYKIKLKADPQWNKNRKRKRNRVKQTEYSEKWRKLHPDRDKASIRDKALIRQRYQNKIELVRSMKDKPCADCGNKFPYYIMDFDHVRGNKKGNISEMIHHKRSIILDEIEKCDIVCANCHRIREYVRKLK